MSKAQVKRPKKNKSLSTRTTFSGFASGSRPERTVVHWGRLLEALYNRQFMSEMRPEHTTISIWRILSALNASGALTVGQIAARSHIERTVVSHLLDRMQSKGLIERSSNRVDRRISDTRMTEKGLALFHRMRPIRQKVYARATSGIDAQRLKLACQVIMEMIDNLGGGDLIRPPRP